MIWVEGGELHTYLEDLGGTKYMGDEHAYLNQLLRKAIRNMRTAVSFYLTIF